MNQYSPYIINVYVPQINCMSYINITNSIFIYYHGLNFKNSLLAAKKS